MEPYRHGCRRVSTEAGISPDVSGFIQPDLATLPDRVLVIIVDDLIEILTNEQPAGIW
jgi:hypothetical protein